LEGSACEIVEQCISRGFDLEPDLGSSSGSGNLFVLVPDFEEDFDYEEIMISGAVLSTTENMEMAPTCRQKQHSLKENGSPWTPHCDCQGYYHSVQCLRLELYTTCWCSTKHGTEITGSRIELECTDIHIQL